MSPWDIPPIIKGNTPCTGGADEYLQLLTNEIVPRAEKLVQGRVLWRVLWQSLWRMTGQSQLLQKRILKMNRYVKIYHFMVRDIPIWEMRRIVKWI